MRRGWLIGWLALAALILLDTIAWRAAVGQLAAGADRWIADARRQGWVITEHERRRGGWPLAATLTIVSPDVAGGDAVTPNGLHWSSAALVLGLTVFHPQWLSLTATGEQHLRIASLPDMAFAGTQLAASIKLWGGGEEAARIDATALSAGIAGPQDLRAAKLGQLHLRLTGVTGSNAGWPSATLAFQAAAFALPDTLQWPLGATISRLSGTLALRSPSAGPPGRGDLESQARTWRDGGGTLDARDVQLQWGPLTLSATASVTLDKQLQPAGSGNAELAGSQETLAALTASGFLTPAVAAAAGAMLAFLPRAPGTADALLLPFLLRNGIVSVGGIPVLAAKPFRWR